jgi:double-stranded uracil-DNA glycosylase
MIDETRRHRVPPPDVESLRLRDRLDPRWGKAQAEGVPRVLFVGINPGIRSAQTGHHFAGYSNRFWRLLYESALVPEPLTFERDVDLPRFGFGITNLIARPTPGIDTLRPDEYAAGRGRLLRKIARLRPEVVAFVGVTLYRAVMRSSGSRSAAPIRLGLQAETLSGARVFVLPNPSGRNANFSYGQMLGAFIDLRRFAASAAADRERG